RKPIPRVITERPIPISRLIERFVRRLFFHRRRPLPTNRAGAVTRGAAFAIDAVLINLFFNVLAGAVTLLATFFGGSGDGVPRGALAAGSFVWLVGGGTYLVGFWAWAGQTPGMRFLGIRLNERRLPPGRSIKRLIGMGLSVITLGIGFLGVVFGESRRSWADRMGHTEVVYDERRPAPAPWSTLSEPAAAPPPAPVAEPPDEVPSPAPRTGSAGPAAPAA